MLLAELDRVEWGESVLEFAPGTGWWTAELAKRVESVMAVDSAPEVLTLNQDRVGSRNVEYVQADIFDWGPGRRYDAVFFSFCLFSQCIHSIPYGKGFVKMLFYI